MKLYIILFFDKMIFLQGIASLLALTALQSIITPISAALEIKSLSSDVYLYPKKTCVVEPSNGTDDSPAILEAFRNCRSNGHVIFLNQTYRVGQVMSTTGLKNVDIDLYGTLLVSFNFRKRMKCSMMKLKVNSGRQTSNTG